MSKADGLEISREQLLALTEFRNLQTLGKIALFVAIMALLSWGAWNSELEAVDLLAYFALGYMWMGMVTFMHEATHNTLFPKKWQNWVFGIITMIPLVVTFVSFKEDHLEHHRYNRSPKDPDAFTMGRRGVLDFIAFYAYIVAGALLTLIHFTFIYPIKYFDRRRWAIHCGEIALKAVCYIAFLSWAQRHGVRGEVLALWFAPVIAFSVFNSMRFLVEHYETPWNTGKLAGTRTVISNPVHSFFWNNINFHAGHHLYPRVPCYNLVKLHRLLEAQIVASGAVIDKSYVAVFAKAVMCGPESEARLTQALERRQRKTAPQLRHRP
jgi:fatty acid desaturase